MASNPPTLENHPLNVTVNQASAKRLLAARKSVKAEMTTSVPQQYENEIDFLNLADMMVLLIGKWRQAYWMTVACLVLILACIVMLVKAGFEMNYLQEHQALLQEELRKTKDEVRKNTNEVKETRDVVRETKDVVKEAAEAAPKVEVDDQGKARVVIRVSASPTSDNPPPPKKRSGSSKKAIKKPPSEAMAPPSQTSVPLNPELGLDY